MLKTTQIQKQKNNFYYFSNDEIVYAIDFDKVMKLCSYDEHDNDFLIMYSDGTKFYLYTSLDEYRQIKHAFEYWCLNNYNKI